MARLYVHIPQQFAPHLNQFYHAHLNPYINYHRPCFFAVTIADKCGKEKKTYPYDAMMTPYEKFISLPEPQQYLKAGITWEELAILATQSTDLEAANQTQLARKKVFDLISKSHTSLLN
jgi:hypothetical protein